MLSLFFLSIDYVDYVLSIFRPGQDAKLEINKKEYKNHSD